MPDVLHHEPFFDRAGERYISGAFHRNVIPSLVVGTNHPPRRNIATRTSRPGFPIFFRASTRNSGWIKCLHAPGRGYRRLHAAYRKSFRIAPAKSPRLAGNCSSQAAQASSTREIAAFVPIRKPRRARSAVCISRHGQALKIQSKISKRQLKFILYRCRAAVRPPGSHGIAFRGRCSAEAGRRPVLRDAHDGEIQNVQASLIDGLLEL